MVAINPDKCLVFCRSEKSTFARTDLPSDWLNQLSTMCSKILELSEADAGALKTNFQRHVGSDSTYSLKKEVLEGLEVIYMRLSASGKNALNDSSKAAIAYKLKEGAGACTAGFHDRVNDLVMMFSIPQSLDAHLSRIRYDIIDKVARQATDEVHAHNQFYVQASVIGYGVTPPNQNDTYRGQVPIEQIRNNINAAFNSDYKCPLILDKLIEGIKSVLHTEYEYTGLKKEPAHYYSGEYGKFFEYLGKILGPECDGIPAAEYLIVNSNDEVVDLNWAKIKETLFNKLVTEIYIAFSRNEQECITSLLRLENDVDITALCVRSDSPKLSFIQSTNQLCHFLSFLSHLTLETQFRLIDTYVNLKPQKSRVALLLELSHSLQPNKGLVALIIMKILAEAEVYDVVNLFKNKSFFEIFDDLSPDQKVAILNRGDIEDTILTHLVLSFFTDLNKTALKIVNSLPLEQQLMLYAKCSEFEKAYLISSFHVTLQAKILTEVCMEKLVELLQKPMLLNVFNELPFEQQERALNLNQVNMDGNSIITRIFETNTQTLILEAVLKIVNKKPLEQQQRILASCTEHDKRELIAATNNVAVECQINCYKAIGLDNIMPIMRPGNSEYYPHAHNGIEMAVQLGVFEKKIERFSVLIGAEDENSPFKVAQKLYNALKDSLGEYKKSVKNEASANLLKTSWIASINEARPVLSTHRGMKEVLAKLLVCATVVGAFFLAYRFFTQGKNYTLTQTDSDQQLDKMLHSSKKI